MPDDTNPAYLAGLIVGIKEHLDRQDAQHAMDKAEAIAAREAKHAENLGRFNELGVRIDKIDARVTALEDDKRARNSEAQGEHRVWNFLYGVASAVGGAIVALVSADWESVKRIFHG